MEQVSLTKKQRGLLEVLLGKGTQGARLSELARDLGLASESGVREQLAPLIRLGLAERREVLPFFKPAVITRAGQAALGLRSDVGAIEQIAEPAKRQKMRQFDTVHAGECGVEFEPAPALVTLESCLGVRPGDDYVFTVDGECMMPVFRPGDTVAMRPDSRPPDGSIVHVDVQLSEDAWEPLLRIYQADVSRGRAWLTHINPTRETLEVPLELVQVRGRFIGFWRDAQSAQEMLREMSRAEAQAEIEATSSVRKVQRKAPAHINTSLNSNGIAR